MGHASIQTTFDKYGHLMPGGEAEAAGLLDSYLTVRRGPPDDPTGTATGTRVSQPRSCSGTGAMYYI